MAFGACYLMPLISTGKSVADALPSIGVTEVTYYRWCQAFDALKFGQVKRLKAFETENPRLRRAIANPTLDKLIRKEAVVGNRRSAPGKLLSPVRRRGCIEHVRLCFDIALEPSKRAGITNLDSL